MTAEEFYKKYLFIDKDSKIDNDYSLPLNKAIEMAEIYHETNQRGKLLEFTGWLYGNLDKEIEKKIVDEYLKTNPL